MQRCSLSAEEPQVGCALCYNICGEVSLGGVGLYIYNIYMCLFISGSDCGKRRWSRMPEAHGDAVPGTAPDRCAHAQLLTRRQFCNHLTYSHFTLHLHICTMQNIPCTGTVNLLKRDPILVACEPSPTRKCRGKVRGRRSSLSHHHQSTAIEQATIGDHTAVFLYYVIGVGWILAAIRDRYKYA